MAAHSELRQEGFASERFGFTATRQQREVGTSYVDAVATAPSTKIGILSINSDVLAFAWTAKRRQTTKVLHWRTS